MKSFEKGLNFFGKHRIILVVLCYTFIHSMSLRFLIVSGQFNYTKTSWFHAIFMPDNIEFSMCTALIQVRSLSYLYINRNTIDLCIYNMIQ